MLRALLRVLTPRRRFDSATEVELLVLRHEIKLLRRQVPRPKLQRRDRLILAAASRLVPKSSWTAFIVTPQTILRWHRELVRRKWTYGGGRIGRPPKPDAIRDLAIKMASDNPGWGYQRIKGELKKLGISLSATTIRTILLKNGLGPAPRRTGPTWRQFIRAQASAIVACDFFTVETAWLRTICVLFFMHVGTRRILGINATYRPDAVWVTQQARNLFIELPQDIGVAKLIHDRDSNYGGSFDEVFSTEGCEVVRTPYRAPQANAFAERWVRTVRQECLDHLLIMSRQHLESVLHEYKNHYNKARPHRGLDLGMPEPRPAKGPDEAEARIICKLVLGGLIHEYELAA